jgi:hypothetical protein
MTFGGPLLLAPLTSMLGIRPGMNVSVRNAPSDFMERLVPLPEGAHLMDSASTGLDVIIVFAKGKVEVVERLSTAVREMALIGAIWVIFPYGQAGDQWASEDFIRLCGLELGLTDTKRLVFDETFMGLKLQHRAKPPRPEIPRAEA